MKAKKIDNASHKYKRQSLKHKQKEIRCSILIVCEGTKTEPNYFNSFKSTQQGLVVYDIQIKGIGSGAMTVANKAIKLKRDNNFDRVWAVFDKDECTSKCFNEAICLCNNNGVCTAWSNEAFELWYLYHFQNVTTGLHRSQYADKISSAVNSSSLYKSKKRYQYAKNDPKNYEIMTKYGSIESALKFSEAQHTGYSGNNYASQNPCTTVYRLVRQLLGRDDELKAELIGKIDA
ncbi:MAG TPA: RloB family protein [Candidatus Coprenecus stercoravium]|uniref:RloB family protein n=1 Tax=Candidatus Coprenecus stercoravium TaxID=2840735 RepID=A0A9D2GPV4_9BACT|nr:RloB family protein [Candidatus Coprenecus stercoravium]